MCTEMSVKLLCKIGDIMKEFLEKALKQRVSIEEDTELYERLPLVYRGRYTIYNVTTNGLKWIAIRPKIEVGLIMLRKDRAKLEKEANLNCALFLDRPSFYIKERLVEEGIPFAIKDKQVYLPFIGCLLAGVNERELPPVQLISYLTQKLILTAIYENWQWVKVSDAAVNLGVSKMSASRCFDELEYLDIDILRMKGKSRVVCMPEDLKLFWNRTADILRSPVINRYMLREDVCLDKKGGISALCEYSLLSDNEYPTYAITKKEIRGSGIREKRQVKIGDDIGCVVLELGYFIDFEGKKIEDPLSLVLSLTDEEVKDERISISIEKMMENYVWSKD